MQNGGDDDVRSQDKLRKSKRIKQMEGTTCSRGGERIGPVETPENQNQNQDKDKPDSRCWRLFGG